MTTMRHPLIYSGIGVYVPHVTPSGIEWQRNEDGNPFVGVEVTSISNVKKFAELAKVERLKEDSNSGTL